MPIDGRFIDQNGEQDFTDENDVSLFQDATGIYFLGIGDVVVTDKVLTQTARYNDADVFPGHGIIPDILPADRQTVWNPGLNSVGGIPERTTIFATVAPLTVGADNGPTVQAALDDCPAGQVVLLQAGTYTFDSASKLIIRSGITLRGAGAGVTILQKLDGATDLSFVPGPNAAPVIEVSQPLPEAPGIVADLSADAVKGAFSITVADATGLAAGQIGTLDELSGADWQLDPQGHGDIWASDDFRVVWQKHDPELIGDDFGDGVFPIDASGPTTSFPWCYADRPTAETKEIASVVGNVVTFTTPIHISYRVSHAAQFTTFDFVSDVGLENFTVERGDKGNIFITQATRCWIKGVECRKWLDEGFKITFCHKLEIRDCYIHDTVWPIPGGGGYGLSLANGTAEVLIENCISVRVNKVMVCRCAGAGSVVGYNYMDMGYINYDLSWLEIGINASHAVGPHHVLFEGNYSHNADSDKTHGNSVYMTYFRNHLRGIRSPFTSIEDVLQDDATMPCTPPRCVGPMAFGYWFSFIGNVLGAAGQMMGWDYEGTIGTGSGTSIWLMGWDDVNPHPTDPTVAATIIRDGNWDWLTNSQQWHNTPATYAIPNSLYLSAKPAFFGANAWPWVDPSTGATAVLPAKARYDTGFPNGAPPEPAFQQNAFQTDAYQVEALTPAPAFQTSAFQNDSFQVELVGVLEAALYADSDTFFGALAVPGEVALTVEFFAAADVFPDATLTPGTRALTAALVADNDIFPVGTIALAGVQPIAMPFSTDSDVFFTATLTNLLKVLSPALYVEADTFLGHTLTSTIGLSAGLYADADGFLSHTMASASFLSGSLYEDADTFYLPLIGKDPEVLAGALFGDEDEFPRHSMTVDIHYDFPIGRGMLADYGMRRMRTSGLVIGRR